METRLRELNSMNLNLLFSLDGDAFAHNLARRSAGGSFRRVEKSLRMASKATMDFGISAVVGEHNIDNLTRLVQYIFEEFQPKSLGLNLPHYTRQQPWNRIEEYTEAIIEIYSYAKKYNLFIDQIHRRLQPLLTQKFRYRDCSAQGEKRVYFPGGIVSSCVNEFGLNNRNIDWANRIPLKSPECRECFAIGVCGGGCVFDGEAIYGQGRFDQRNCYFTRKFLEYLIWDLMDKKGEDIAVKSQSNLRFSVGHETI
jgi:radical SAM protein with 4Fe4S-binding SPASM domain